MSCCQGQHWTEEAPLEGFVQLVDILWVNHFKELIMRPLVSL